MDISRCRLRCIGHIINLVVRAVIFGSNISRFEAELRGATDEFSFDIWAKRGAIGRLHNLATYIRRTDQRRQALRRLQAELAGDDAIFTLEIVVDGKTRWSSIYVMINAHSNYAAPSSSINRAGKNLKVTLSTVT